MRGRTSKVNNIILVLLDEANNNIAITTTDHSTFVPLMNFSDTTPF